MSGNNRRHGGHMLPDQMMFPPAVPQNPQPYGHPEPWRSSNPYSQPSYMPSPPPPPPPPPPQTQPGTPSSPTRRKKLQKKHGGELSPEDHFSEKAAASDVISIASSNTRPGSRGSPQTRRHGGSLLPEDHFEHISQVRSQPTRPPPQVVPPEQPSHYSPAPSFNMNERSYRNESPQEYPYAVTTNTSTQPMVPAYAPSPPVTPAAPPGQHQIGYRNIWHATSLFRWHKPVHFHKHANLKYGKSPNALARYRHRDAAGRVYEGIDEERFILVEDVHLARMMVQAADNIYQDDSSTTWRRTFIRNRAPWMIRIANWPTNTAPASRDHWTGSDWALAVLKWPFSCLALSVLVLSPTYYIKPPHMKYPALVYKYWGYAKVCRNALESENFLDAKEKAGDATNAIANRPLNPRCLWLLDPNTEIWSKIIVEDWLGPNNDSIPFPFILVAYTANQFDHDSQSDINALHQIARQAAADAGVEAYWCADSCMSTNDEEMEQDVFRISDVIRAAHSLSIALKQPNTASRAHSDDRLLKEWGSRMWTLPEALLGPKDQPVRIYRHQGSSAILVRTAARRQLPSLLWADAPLTRQLIDHYEGNISLSRLELVIIALKALSTRATSPYLRGDLAYILMGLLRRRPHVTASDTQFQAFARLSLANDSDRLLERLLAIQPADPLNQPWYLTDDAYAAQLWDIEPTCQIAAVCDADTVVLDGCFAASIRWETFVAPWHRHRASWKRLFADLLMRGVTSTFLWTLIGLLYLATFGLPVDSAAAVLGLCAPVWLLSPWLTRIMFSGKPWDVAPYLMGFEGYLPIETVEEMVYGFRGGKLKWSVAGSPLSRHCRNQWGECVGADPVQMDEEVRAKVAKARTASFGDMRVFTLVDTRNGLVTLFESVRPPSAVVFVAQEGGMQRGVMVSLDWKNSTLYRECVLRMPTLMIQDCWRVDRVRVGFKREVEATVRDVSS